MVTIQTYGVEAVRCEAIVAARHTWDWSKLAAVAIVACVVCFYRLGEPAIYWWDEARVALNSLEMMHSANPLVVTFNGQADLWNTKPPLTIWLNALSMRLFGVNEFALRLPSAMAAIGTTLAVFQFTRRISDTRTALLASLILLGIGGYIAVHVARTADYDSPLVLFTTLTTFSLFFAFDSKRFYPSAGYVSAAFLTKGIAGIMMAPGYLLYAMICKKDLRPAALPGLTAMGMVLLYFLARETFEPGYLHAVWLQDIRRFNLPAEGNGREVVEYLTQLFFPWQVLFLNPTWSEPFYISSAFPWTWIALLALLRPSKAATYLFCCIGTYLVIISIASTHHPWYVAPVFPLIAVLAALGVQRTVEIVRVAFLFPVFAGLSIACVGLNVWKLDREQRGVMLWRERGQSSLIQALPQSARVQVQPDIVWRTPAVRDGKIVGTELYFGALEFYRRQRPQGAVQIVCVAEPFIRDLGRAFATSCYPPNVRPKGPAIHRLTESPVIPIP